MSPPRNKPKKDPVGTGVFYPKPLPQRGSPRVASKGPSTTPGSPTNRPSTSLHPWRSPESNLSTFQPRALSLEAIMNPIEGGPVSPFHLHQEPTEFPFPPSAFAHPPEPESSPATRLRNIVENWNIFTPSPVSNDGRLPETDGRGSISEMSILSPPELSLSELIDDTLIDHDTQSAPLSRDADAVSGLGLDSPAPKTGPYASQILSSTSPLRNPGSFYLASPRPVPSSPLSRPIPFRQAAWSTSEAGRRASVPNVAQLTASPFNSVDYLVPSASPQIPRPTRTPSPLPSSHLVSSQPHLGDVFSADYSLASPSTTAAPRPAEYTFPAPGNSLSLEIPVARPATITDQQHELPLPAIYDTPEHHTPAEFWLRDRKLDERFSERYELRDELGSGGFGFVCSAVCKGYDNLSRAADVAVKFVFKDKLQEGENVMPNGEPVESYVMSQLDHPSIIRYHGLYHDDDFFYLVQELHGDPWEEGHTLVPPPNAHDPLLLAQPVVPSRLITDAGYSGWSPASVFSASPSSDRGGWSPSPGSGRPNMGRRPSHDLFEAVENNRFSEDEARTIFRQIVDGVAYLHSKQIYHRDLKDENIVIDRALTIKIIDFGSAIIGDRWSPPMTEGSFRGTLTYAAPEVLNGEWYMNSPTDIWSLGIILGIVLTGESPFPNHQYSRVGRMKLKRQVSSDAMDLLARCLHTDPADRAHISCVAKHRWLRGPMAHRGSV